MPAVGKAQPRGRSRPFSFFFLSFPSFLCAFCFSYDFHKRMSGGRSWRKAGRVKQGRAGRRSPCGSNSRLFSPFPLPLRTVLPLFLAEVMPHCDTHAPRRWKTARFARNEQDSSVASTAVRAPLFPFFFPSLFFGQHRRLRRLQEGPRMVANQPR